MSTALACLAAVKNFALHLRELLQQWEWTERYPTQPEILRYLERIAAKHDRERDIQLDTKVLSGEYDEAAIR